jgi:transketolase
MADFTDSRLSSGQAPLNQPPYPTVLKPYGQSLVALAKERDDVVCLTGDLSKQCEIDLFADAYPERFIHAGMAEANMMGVAGALARDGFVPYVHTFGTFATRRPLDQVINAIAFPNLKVRIMGFMPGVSSPGGPSHQAIDDVALMRSVPNMTVVDVADAVEGRQVASAIVDVDGPVYVRLKRGEIPVIFGDDHRLRLDRAQPLTPPGGDVALLASGMMVAPALAAGRLLGGHGVAVSVVNVPVIKPLDAATVTDAATAAKVVVTAENHTVVGGLGSAVAEVLAEAGLGRPLRRVGLRDTFAEGSRTGPYLFGKYALSTQALVDAAWAALGRRDRAPAAAAVPAEEGEYSPV